MSRCTHSIYRECAACQVARETSEKREAAEERAAIKVLVCGCCTEGCMCFDHHPDHQRIYCAAHGGTKGTGP